MLQLVCLWLRHTCTLQMAAIAAQITVASAAGNQFSGSLPEEWHRLANLQNLDVSLNKVAGAAGDPDGLSQLPSSPVHTPVGGQPVVGGLW